MKSSNRTSKQLKELSGKAMSDSKRNIVKRKDVINKVRVSKDVLLTWEEASKLVSFSKSYLYWLLCKKKITYIKKDERFYFRYSDLLQIQSNWGYRHSVKAPSNGSQL